MQHSDQIILQKILNAVDVALNIFGCTSKDEFLSSEILKLSMTMSVIRIGELVKNLSQNFRIENNQIKWKPIAGFRDVAAHKYETLSFERVYNTIKNDFPELKYQIEKIIEKE